MTKLLISAAVLTVLSMNVAEARMATVHSVHPYTGIPRTDAVDAAAVVANHPEAGVVGCTPYNEPYC